MKTQTIKLVFAPLLLAIAICMAGCKKEQYTPGTTADVNMVGYFRNHLDSFSLFQQILDKTGNTDFLNAYGRYTCFAPTNSGVRIWLSSIGAASVDVADMDKMKDMVRFHLLNDTITTGAFTDGKLPVPTMYGQYLITGVAFGNDVSSYTVNRQANLLQSNIRVGNGIIHVIDHVLQLAELTLAKKLEADPNYSIFVQAMKETGYYDTLNKLDADTSKRFMTLFAESNKVLADSGITTFAQLKAKYSRTGNTTLATDSLHVYMAYHILGSLQFLGDIISQSAQVTKQPQEVVSVKLIDQNVVLNEDVFNGIFEKGVTLNRATSDNAASNGVWHTAGAHFMVKFRKPTAVYWDVCTFPEIMNQAAYYKKQSLSFAKPTQEARPIASIDWEVKLASASINYSYGTGSTLQQSSCNSDALEFNFGLPNRAGWMDLKTPAVIKGRYKVWVCYSAVNGIVANVYVNGTLMQRTVNFGEYKASGTDNERESIGWKRYTSSIVSTRPSARLVGIIDIATTGIQTVRFTGISGTGLCYLDMIHFIPVDDPQYLPRFDPNGLPVYL